MPRRPRQSLGGMLFHVLNRGAGRERIFKKEFDYLAFENVLAEVNRRLPTRILCYCLMPTHWHLVLWPREDGELSEFMRLITVTHTQRWHSHHRTSGTGPLYQGRFKSFPIERDEHLLTVCRYVERNALRAGLEPRAEAWQWGSLWKRMNEPQTEWLMKREDWPAESRQDWLQWVNRNQTAAEEAALADSIKRGRPFGTDRWQRTIAAKLDLESSLRPRGRPRIKQKDSRPLN